jgi:hypothetical protein
MVWLKPFMFTPAYSLLLVLVKWMSSVVVVGSVLVRAEDDGAAHDVGAAVPGVVGSLQDDAARAGQLAAEAQEEAVHTVGDVAAEDERAAFLHADARQIPSHDDVARPLRRRIHTGLEASAATRGGTIGGPACPKVLETLMVSPVMTTPLASSTVPLPEAVVMPAGGIRARCW